MFDDWTILIVLAIAAGLAIAAVIFIAWLKHGPRGEVIVGLLWRFLRFYCRIVHRARYLGLESLRDQLQSGPMIVVSNHTGAIDPLLIQAGCRFHIRWMMASDMMMPLLSWLWRHERVIPVDRLGKGSSAAREAIRHVQAGGCIGIFPEGRIVVPPRQIRPFHPGVGLIVARTQAPVLLVWVAGTPEHAKPTPAKSIITPSGANVTFIDVIDFKGERDAAAITQTLRHRIAQASNWSLNDESMARD